MQQEFGPFRPAFHQEICSTAHEQTGSAEKQHRDRIILVKGQALGSVWDQHDIEKNEKAQKIEALPKEIGVMT